ncbi:ABC transporter ATP-binding protein [Selenomonas sputigena]|uniref:ABC transporter, ATP-binding protein n=1 Tax=Selenomonas sputigena (strain ATCC 35185 / DSM 20758 / CCUG 44933 / VPI D19B-28) TaxID=546271 RepID=C9LS55_SELS3|nr:ABC transporter ATP-binding protein [Selenomonas sputigena]AEB99905.1 Taurine-transporting ATPase [Selenomonas sputigena ATCC 35185]EEX78334.1 ABC transporter, ATP-binding protein [Selenomonas sputigena ATCC 35185]
MIDLQHLSYGYRVDKKCMQVLHDINMHVEKGEICSVIGPSGCGKSTLLKIIAGLLHDYDGTAMIDGVPVDPKRQRVGFMPQNYGLLPWKTVRENVELGGRIRYERVRENETVSMMQRLGIDAFSERYPKELSGGQQQRVGLARAFLLRPDVLLMDEPFSALDAITREEMQEVFLSLWHEQHVTTVLVTHYVEEALYLGQRIVILADAPGRIAEVLDNPLFGCIDQRNKVEFFRMSCYLREQIKKRWRRA